MLVLVTELRATSTDGATIAALDEGSGPALLVVHPGGLDASSWDGVTKLLTDEFRVVRIQRRIYAPGAELPRNHSMAVEAADILAILDLLDRPVLLVGHSSGAVAALEAALLVPASSFSAILVYEPPMPTRTPLLGEAGPRSRAALQAGDPVEAMRIHLRDIVRMPAREVDAMLLHPAARAAFSATAAPQVTDNEAIEALGVGMDRFAALDVPTTLVEGDCSPAHLRERVADLASVLPHARVVTLPGQGHIAHLLAPETLAAAIRELAARVTG